MKFNFINRDISLLYFYNILLEKAANCGLSFFERIRYLAFYSENIDEYSHFRINRYLNKKIRIHKAITNILSIQHDKQNTILNDILYNSNLISLRCDWNKEDIESAKIIYQNLVESSIVELKYNDTNDMILDNQIYLCVKISKNNKSEYKIISSNLFDSQRFIKSSHSYFYSLEDIIQNNIERIFPDVEIKEIYSFRLLRNLNISYRKETTNPIEIIEKGIINRLKANFTIGFYEFGMFQEMLNYIINFTNISDNKFIPTHKLQKVGDILKIDNELINKAVLDNRNELYHGNIYQEIVNKDIFLQYPKDSFNSLITYIEDAILDKNVTSIYITWYRFSKISRIKELLIEAVNNNIKVNVVIELKAKMEEERNLKAYRELRNTGVNVILTPNTLKVHAKMLLIIKSSKTTEKYYSYISTGNFNEKTAKAYVDYALLTSKQEIGLEIYQLFQEIIDNKITKPYEYILLSPYNMKEKILDNIYSEIRNIKSGKKAKIFAIMNGLQDKSIITALYEASMAGVKIELIVRGMCRLIPNKPYSTNIRLKRRVSNYLEHERLYYFNNNGNSLIYIGSADWMTKKVTKRLEILVPILDRTIISKIENDIIKGYDNDPNLYDI